MRDAHALNATGAPQLGHFRGFKSEANDLCQNEKATLSQDGQEYMAPN